jgi:hypothetical protein
MILIDLPPSPMLATTDGNGARKKPCEPTKDNLGLFLL